MSWMFVASLPYLVGLFQARRRVNESRFRIGSQSPPCQANQRVSVVIPARNEVNDIQPAIESVLQQDHANVEVVVMDDGSTDGTTELLAGLSSERLTVVAGEDAPLPDGWLGKPWACHRAAKRATGDWLLLIDADVRLSPEAVSRSVAYAQEHDLGLLSGLGQLVNVSFGERVIQPIVTGLIIAANDLVEVNDPQRPEKALASGQFLLFRRSAYEAIRGHEAVRGNVLDDVGLALAVKGASLGFHCVHMRSLYRCRMYSSGLDCWRGWRKNLFPGMEGRWTMLAATWLFFILCLVVPLVGLGLGALTQDWPLVISALVPLGMMHLLRWYLDGVYGQSRWFGLMTYILGQMLFVILVVDSAWFTTRGKATWKGRTIPNQSS